MNREIGDSGPFYFAIGGGELSEHTREFCGRRVLTATPPGDASWQSIGKILDDVMVDFKENSRQTNDLYWFYRGDQPVLDRQKTVRKEINNRVVENRAFEVVEFKKGYEFSHPVQYTNASTKNDAIPLDILNTYARLDAKESKDLDLAEWRYIAGTAYRLALPWPREYSPNEDDAPYFTESLDPRSTFVVYSTDVGHRPICSGTYSQEKVNNQTQYRVGVYTDTQYFEWVLPGLTGGFSTTKPRLGTNGIGRNPIIEYPLNSSRLGYVELCYHLYNAVNTLDANRTDALEQFVQALLVFVNCDFDSDVNGNPVIPRTGDAISIKGAPGAPASVQYLVEQLDQGGTQITKDDLLEAIYEICGIPSRQNRNSGGGDTGQAVVLRNGWGSAEARAKSSEKVFKKSEMDYLRVVLEICRADTKAAAEIDDLTLRDVDVRFTRNRSDAMQTKAQTLQILLASGVNPEDAYEYCEMFSDPTAVWAKSKIWQEENAVTEEPEPKPVSPAQAENIQNTVEAASEADQNSATM